MTSAFEHERDSRRVITTVTAKTLSAQPDVVRSILEVELASHVEFRDRLIYQTDRLVSERFLSKGSEVILPYCDSQLPRLSDLAVIQS